MGYSLGEYPPLGPAGNWPLETDLPRGALWDEYFATPILTATRGSSGDFSAASARRETSDGACLIQLIRVAPERRIEKGRATRAARGVNPKI